MPARYFDAAPRSYSPSRPVTSSSEDEQNQDEGLNNGEFTGTSQVPSNQQQAFIPQPEVNTFKMTSEEVDRLSLQDRSPGTLLAVPPGLSFTFIGACYLTVLRGSVSLMGVCLHPSSRSYPVFSPKSDPLALITALEYTSAENMISLPNRILGNTDDTSLILIQSIKMGIESLGNYQIFSQLFQPDEDKNNQSMSECVGVDGLHFVNPFMSLKPPTHTFFLHESWAGALNSFILNPDSDNVTTSKPFVGLVKGPKNCGKSTFARSLLNTILTRYTRVAFLECDIGQSEFTPGGMVSLHVISMPVFGPSFTHPIIPFRAHYIGSSTPRSSPSQYLAAIQALIETYRTEVQNSYENLTEGDSRIGSTVPLVINTQGWIKGLGGDLLHKIEEIVASTAIFDFDPEGSLQTFPSHTSVQVYHVQSALPSPSTQYFTASNRRTFAILSYFHAVFDENASNLIRWNTELPLCFHRPWEISLNKGVNKIILTGSGFEDILPDELHHAINCGLVGLVCDEHSLTEVDNLDEPYYTQGGSIPSPSYSQCVGLALIRGVDLQKGKLHLLTPLPPKILQNCRILVKGELEMPVWGMVDFRDRKNNGVAGVGWGKVPYLQMGHGEAGANVIGAAKRRVRRNLMRKNQIPI